MKLTAKNSLALLKETFQGWNDHKALRLGASLAFYTMFAIAPLFLIALAAAGLIFGEQAAHRQLFDQLQGLLGKQSAGALQAIVADADRPGTGTWAAAIALVTLFIGATGTFVELQDAINTIWQVRRKAGSTLRHFVTDRLLSFAMMLVIGFLLLVSLIVSAGLAALGHFMNGYISMGSVVGQILNFLVSFMVIAALFAMIFKVLPDVKIPWRNTWIGAALSALLFNLGKFAIGLYLARSSIASSYGAAGSLVIILVWVYYSSQTLFFGVEFCRAFTLHSDPNVKLAKGAEFVTTTEAKRTRLAGSHRR